MVLTFAPIVHIVAAIFSIIELGLTAYCTCSLIYLHKSPTYLPLLPILECLEKHH